MRYFLTGRQPAPTGFLLVESGSRGILEDLVPGLRRAWGQDLPIDLVTCYSTLPRGFEAERARVYRVTDYRGRKRRRALVEELRRNGYSHVGILCSAEPILLKWKWVLALSLAAKVFVVNEHGDYFWLDRMHLPAIVQFAVFRAGLAGAGAARTLLHALSFPFVLAYLLFYATAIHARRALHRGES